MMRHHTWRIQLQSARRLYQATQLFYRRYGYEIQLIQHGQLPRFRVSWERLKVAVVTGMHRIAWWRLWRTARSNSRAAARDWAPFVIPQAAFQSQR